MKDLAVILGYEGKTTEFQHHSIPDAYLKCLADQKIIGETVVDWTPLYENKDVDELSQKLPVDIQSWLKSKIPKPDWDEERESLRKKGLPEKDIEATIKEQEIIDSGTPPEYLACFVIVAVKDPKRFSEIWPQFAKRYELELMQYQIKG